MNTARSFQGIWIPKEIWFRKDLSPTEKFLLAEIHSLDKGDGCRASNEYLAEFAQVSPGRIANILTKFRQKELIIDRSKSKKLRLISLHVEF